MDATETQTESASPTKAYRHGPMRERLERFASDRLDGALRRYLEPIDDGDFGHSLFCEAMARKLEGKELDASLESLLTDKPLSARRRLLACEMLDEPMALFSQEARAEPFGAAVAQRARAVGERIDGIWAAAPAAPDHCDRSPERWMEGVIQAIVGARARRHVVALSDGGLTRLTVEEVASPDGFMAAALLGASELATRSGVHLEWLALAAAPALLEATVCLPSRLSAAERFDWQRFLWAWVGQVPVVDGGLDWTREAAAFVDTWRRLPRRGRAGWFRLP